MLKPASQRARTQGGSSLVEVLVAILVVSLGVIAMGGLLASATRLGKASEMRAVASLMAADISERMKANVAVVSAGNYNLTDAFSASASEPAAPTACAAPKACTAAEIAARDLAEWQRAVFHALPAGTGYISYDAGAAAAGGAVDVWVAWLDPTALSTGEFQDIDDLNTKNCPEGFRSKSPQPRCMYFRVGL